LKEETKGKYNKRGGRDRERRREGKRKSRREKEREQGNIGKEGNGNRRKKSM
jgi:hypothetical protein